MKNDPLPISGVRFGCVRFDDTFTHTAGWASIDGEKAVRIASTAELQSDTVWMTNLDYEMWYGSGLTINARFRRNDFLGEPFVRSPREVDFHKKRGRSSGFSPEGDDPGSVHDLVAMRGVDRSDGARSCERVSTLFSRVMRVSQEMVGIESVPMYRLADGFRERFFPPDPIVPDDFAKIVENATVSWVFCERSPSSPDCRTMTLVLPWVAHGCLLSSSLGGIPVAWEEVPKRELPKKGVDLDRWVLAQGGLVLVCVSLLNADPKFSHLVNFGSGKAQRLWVSSGELQLLSTIGTVEVKGAWRSRDLWPIPEIDRLLQCVRPEHELSLSAGLAWQNVWLGLCAPMRQPPHVLRNRVSANPMRPFIRAMDRHICLTLAVKLAGAGIPVLGYGKGRVRVAVARDATDQDVAEMARGLKVIPPFLNLQSTQGMDAENPVHLLQEMHFRGDSERLDQIDQRIVELLCKKD